MVWLKRALALLLAPLLALALAEGAVRVLQAAPAEEMPSPLPFQGKPLEFRPFGSDAYVFPSENPRVGLRKKVGHRAYVVGDSAAAGDGHSHYVSFAGRLETYLWRIDPAGAWEVISVAQ